MTQILSGITSEGIMVATDSMATTFDTEGKETHFPVDKLFSIGSHAFIVSGGMGISVELSKRFKQYAEERRLAGVEDIVAKAGPFISQQFREFLRNYRHPESEGKELDRIYFIVGGYSFRSQDQPYQLGLWGSEGGKLPLQRIQIGPCLAVPRTISGEMRLLKMCQEQCSLGELVEFAKGFLLQLSQVGPQVGPPFRFGTVTSEGFRKLEEDNV